MSNRISFYHFTKEVDGIKVPLGIAFPKYDEEAGGWIDGDTIPCVVKWHNDEWLVIYGDYEFLSFKEEQAKWLTVQQDGRVSVNINKDDEAPNGEVGERASIYRGFRKNEVPEELTTRAKIDRQTLLNMFFNDEFVIGGYDYKLVGDVLLLTHHHGGTVAAIDLSPASGDQIQIKTEGSLTVVNLYTSTYSRLLLVLYCNKK